MLAVVLSAALAVMPSTDDRTLAGVVHDESGGVIAGAIIRVKCGGVYEQVTSDARGAFTASGLPAEACTVDVRRQGFAAGRVSADLTAASADSLQITLSVGPFSSDVLVTPTRGVEEPAFRVPQVTTVLTAQTIASRPHQLLTQVLREEVGILAQSTTTAQGSPVVRGFTGQRNVYLLDGVRFNTAAWRDGPSQYLAWVAPSVVDRMEIIRGPGSVQYGSDALGATINVLTAPPAFSSGGLVTSGSFSGTYASAPRFGAVDGSLSVSGTRFAMSVGGWQADVNNLRTGGGLDSHAAVTRFLGLPSDTFGSRLLDTGFRQSSSFVSGRARLTANSTLHASYLHDAQRDASRYDRVNGGAGIYRSDFDPQTLDFSLVRLDRGRTGMFDHLTATFSVNRQVDGRLEQARPNARIDEQYTSTTAFGYQVQASRSIGTRALILGGGEIYDEYIGGSRTLTEPTGATRADRPDIPDGTRYTSAGLFVQAATEMGPRLNVRGGLRYGRFAFSTKPDLALGVVEERAATNAVTFNTGAVASLTPHINLVGSVSRGFRAANAFDYGGIGLSGGGGFEISPSRAVALGATRGSTDGATAVGTGLLVSALEPETLMAYEGGVKVQAGRLAGSLVGFDLELRGTIDRRTLIVDHGVVGTTIAGFDIIRQDSAGRVYVAADARPIVTRVNVARGRITGFEGTASVALTSQWQAHARLSMANGRDLDTGSALRRMPPIAGGGAVRWERGGWWAEGTATFAKTQTRLSDADISDARIGASRTAASIATYFNGTAVDLGLVRNGVLLATGETLSQVQRRVMGSATTAAMFTSTPGYSVFGARMGLPLRGNADLTVIAENLFDRNYRIHGSGADEPGVNLQIRTRIRF